MTNVVVLVKDRPNLTYQMLRTLAQNTDSKDYTLTVVDDQSDTPLEEHGWVAKLFPKNGTVLRISPSQHITGKARNLGVWWSERYWGRGEWLALLDNDVHLDPGWLSKLTKAAMCSGFGVLGGSRHAYHGINKNWYFKEARGEIIIEETDAVAGYCHFIPWSVWEEAGPLDGHAVGTGQSEDFKFCRTVVEMLGRKVGYISPPILKVCGITNTEGKPATGWETFVRTPGVHYE